MLPGLQQKRTAPRPTSAAWEYNLSKHYGPLGLNAPKGPGTSTGRHGAVPDQIGECPSSDIALSPLLSTRRANVGAGR
jgi:hypothetical protein